MERAYTKSWCTCDHPVVYFRKLEVKKDIYHSRPLGHQQGEWEGWMHLLVRLLEERSLGG